MSRPHRSCGLAVVSCCRIGIAQDVVGWWVGRSARQFIIAGSELEVAKLNMCQCWLW